MAADERQVADSVARPRWRRPWLYWGSDLITAAAILHDAGRRPKLYGICPSRHWALVIVTHGRHADA
jgi:hypothetical protein